VADDETDETTVDDHDPEVPEAPQAPVAPVVPVGGGSEAPAPADRRLGGLLLVIVVVLAALLATAYARTDVPSIADPDWRDGALWAAGAAVGFLGLAFLALAATMASPSSDGFLARLAVAASVIGVVAALVVLGLADVNGGELDSADTAAESATEESPAATDDAGGPAGEVPVPLDEAMDPENLASVAFPVEARTPVVLELTVAGRELIAAAQGCRPRDLGTNEVSGTVVGGSWLQPLVIVAPPVTEGGRTIARCHRIATRLPPEAGFAVPNF
jgi:hypothetical protein